MSPVPSAHLDSNISGVIEWIFQAEDYCSQMDLGVYLLCTFSALVLVIYFPTLVFESATK